MFFMYVVLYQFVYLGIKSLWELWHPCSIFIWSFYDPKLTNLWWFFPTDINLSWSRPSPENLKSTFLQEYSLPPKEVPVENSAEGKSAISTETSPAEKTDAVVEEKSESPEVKETNPATEESDEAAEETTDEKPEVKVCYYFFFYTTYDITT